MGFFRNVFSILQSNNVKNAVVSMNDEKLLQWLGIDTEQTQAISEATYFTCLKMLSETIGKLPLHYYQRTSAGRVKADPTDATLLLTTRPNPYMTPTTLFTTTEMMCQHFGNGYIYIQ